MQLFLTFHCVSVCSTAVLSLSMHCRGVLTALLSRLEKSCDGELHLQAKIDGFQKTSFFILYTAKFPSVFVLLNEDQVSCLRLRHCGWKEQHCKRTFV